MARRWDGDETGRGAAGAGPLLGDVRAFLAEAEDNAWVAEQPEAHLAPHLHRAIEQPGSPWRLTGEGTQDAVYELRLRYQPDEGDETHLRAAAFALLGVVAELATTVVQRLDGDAVVFEVITGIPSGASPFAPHGHTLRLRVSGPVAAATARAARS